MYRTDDNGDIINLTREKAKHGYDNGHIEFWVDAPLAGSLMVNTRLSKLFHILSALMILSVAIGAIVSFMYHWLAFIIGLIVARILFLYSRRVAVNKVREIAFIDDIKFKSLQEGRIIWFTKSK